MTRQKTVSPIRERIYEAITGEKTVREIAMVTGLKYNQVQPRVSELVTAGRVVESGQKREGGFLNHTYRQTIQTRMFELRPLTLNEWLEHKYPKIHKEWKTIRSRVK